MESKSRNLEMNGNMVHSGSVSHKSSVGWEQTELWGQTRRPLIPWMRSMVETTFPFCSSFLLSFLPVCSLHFSFPFFYFFPTKLLPSLTLSSYLYFFLLLCFKVLISLFPTFFISIPLFFPSFLSLFSFGSSVSYFTIKYIHFIMGKNTVGGPNLLPQGTAPLAYWLFSAVYR